METKTIVDITISVVSDFWKKRIMEASTEKDYYRKIYTGEIQKNLASTLSKESKEHFEEEIKKKIKD